GNVSCHCLLRGFRQLVLEPSQSHQVGVQERTGLLFHLPWVGPCRHGEQRFLCGTNRSGGAGADRPLLPDTQRRLSIHENISEWGVWGRGIIFSVLASCSKTMVDPRGPSSQGWTAQKCTSSVCMSVLMAIRLPTPSCQMDLTLRGVLPTSGELVLRPYCPILTFVDRMRPSCRSITVCM